MALPNGVGRAPQAVLRIVEIGGQRQPPGRRLNADYRDREYLTAAEIEKLIKSARKRGRHGPRDGLMIMMAYRHGLRVSELIGLRWSQVDFTTARLTVHRLKGSTGSTHGIPGDELRELRKLRREQEEDQKPNSWIRCGDGVGRVKMNGARLAAWPAPFRAHGLPDAKKEGSEGSRAAELPIRRWPLRAATLEQTHSGKNAAVEITACLRAMRIDGAAPLAEVNAGSVRAGSQHQFARLAALR